MLEHTLDLPSILPHGARVDPTADGFLIWLPTCELPCRPTCSVLRLRDYAYDLFSVLPGELRKGMQHCSSQLLPSPLLNAWHVCIARAAACLHTSASVCKALPQSLTMGMCMTCACVLRSPAESATGVWHPLRNPDWAGLWV